jgi:hypothetical protein
MFSWDGGEQTPVGDIALVLNMLHHTKDQELTLKNLNASEIVFEGNREQRPLVEKYYSVIKEAPSHRTNRFINIILSFLR